MRFTNPSSQNYFLYHPCLSKSLPQKHDPCSLQMCESINFIDFITSLETVIQKGIYDSRSSRGFFQEKWFSRLFFFLVMDF